MNINDITDSMNSIQKTGRKEYFELSLILSPQWGSKSGRTGSLGNRWPFSLPHKQKKYEFECESITTRSLNSFAGYCSVLILQTTENSPVLDRRTITSSPELG